MESQVFYNSKELKMEDRLQPYSEQLEIELINAILNDTTAIELIYKIVSQEAFYFPVHALIFEASKNNYLTKQPTTPDAIIETLRESGNLSKVGGIQAVNEIRYKIFSTIDVGYNAAIIFQKFIRREAIRASHITLANAYDESKDEFNLLDEMVAITGNIHNHLSGAIKKSISDFAESYYKETIDIMNNGGGIRGLRTYISSIDYRLGGLCSGRMILFAGRPGSGKTAFIIQLVNNMCLDKKKSKLPTIVYSMEMSGEELINRLVSGLLRYPYEKISKGDIPIDIQDNWQRAVNHIKESNLHIVDNMNDIRSIAADLRLRRERDGVKLAVFDYLQLIRAPEIRKSGNREEEVGHVGRITKALAKELKIPIVALAQLNREVEKRATKKPQLADLRDSGSLEMDADSVTFIFRPKYAGMEKDENGNEISDNLAYLITAKNRHGATGEDETYCDIACNIFTDVNQ